MDHSTQRGLCKLLAFLAMICGGVGMAMSFLYLASSNIADIHAGTSGFVAGAVLIGSGLLSLTLLVCSDAPIAHEPESTSIRAGHP
jgi:hypothetical protein